MRTASRLRYYNNYPDPKDPLQVQLDKYCGYFPHWLTRYTHRKRIDRIISLVDIKRDIKILDVGCGTGAYTILCASKGAHVFGLDLKRNSLRGAKAWSLERGLRERVCLIAGDSENLPFVDDYFDIIICSEVLEHLNRPRKGAGELARVLKKGGIAIVSMPNLLSYYWMREKLKQILKRLIGKQPEQNPHLEFPFWRITRILRSVGLKIVDTTSTYITPLEPRLLGVLIGYAPRLVARINDIEKKICRLIAFKYLGAFLIVTCSKTSFK